MKKFLALALALVMALALAAPAMAFTDKAVGDEYLPELSIELVEFENDEFFGIVGAAPSDRGYAKNEIVAFIVSLAVAKDEDTGDFNRLEITGENVSFNTTEVAQWSSNAPKLWLSKTKAFYFANFDAVVKGKATLQWLGFAKVTGDDASITAKLFVEGEDDATKFVDNKLGFYGEEDDRYVITNAEADTFIVYKNKVAIFAIEVNAKGETTALKVYSAAGDVYKVLVNNAGQYLFLNAANGDVEPGVKAQKALYNELSAIVDDEFEGVFGFDYDLLGGVVDRKTFEAMTDYDKIEVTVDIAPWTAYVQVPDIIVVDPPKTGDATVLVGIVMAIVAAAGVVVFNKVRA